MAESTRQGQPKRRQRRGGAGGHDKQFLLRQRQGWYAVIEVPPSLRKKLGRRIKRTLGTPDVDIARAKRWRVIADIRAEIEAARRVRQGDPVTQEALAYREALDDAEKRDTTPSDGARDHPAAGEDTEADLLRDAVKGRAEAIERAQGYAAAQAFYEIATRLATPLATYVDAWLSEGTLKGRALRKRTETERRKAVEKFGAWMEGARLAVTVEAVTRKVAGRYVSEALLPSGRDAVTLGKTVQSLTSYWAWIQRRGHLPDEARNPWAGQAPQKAARDSNGIAAERSFTDAEVARLLAAPPNGIMADFIRVGALTGMRREEIGQLTVADCTGGVFVVRSGKTEAAARRVPIHPELVAIAEARTKGKAPGAFLFHELQSKNVERTDPIGKAFTRYRRELGIQEGTGRRSRVNLHSLRRWFITTAVNAKQPPHMVSLVVGHQEGRKGHDVGALLAGGGRRCIACGGGGCPPANGLNRTRNGA